MDSISGSIWLQGKLLIHAGEMGHFIPLHTVPNKESPEPVLNYVFTSLYFTVKSGVLFLYHTKLKNLKPPWKYVTNYEGLEWFLTTSLLLLSV